MTDRRETRNRIAISLTSRPSMIPPLADGSRTVVVVFTDEEVGTYVQKIANEYNGHAHIVVIDVEGELAGGLSISSSPTTDREHGVNTLQSSISFGVLMAWIESVHDGKSALQFVFGDAPAVEIAEDHFKAVA